MAVDSVQVHINGQNFNLNYNSSSGKWEATITAPSATSWHEPNNRYGVTVTATDDAGNSTVIDRNDPELGANLQLRVLEKVAPVVNLSSPSAGARITTAMPTFVFTLRDTGSGVNLSSLVFKIDGGTAIGSSATGMTCNSVSGGYDCTYTPPSALAEGSHTVTIQVADNDGNASNIVSSGFTIDTVAPALNVSSPANGYITNNPSLTISGTTNDTTSTPVTVTIKLNGVDQGPVSVSSGSFSKAVTLSEGQNTIEIRATDSSGLYTTVTRTVELDTIAPTISAVTIAPNPVDGGQTFVITVTVNDPE